MKKEYIENTIMIIVLVIFCILTITGLLNHTPWFDEIHAWQLAKIMNFNNFISILHDEGHFIIWYLILMPFAKLNLLYPYSLKFLNWAFYFLAIFIMWRKAPFNPVAKTIITFAWISIYYMPIVARCYTVGILGLFILASLYNKQTKHPILYSLMLVFTAHTSILATFPVIPLAFIFLHELNKTFEKKNKFQYILPLCILTIGIIFWVLPFITGFGNKELLINNPPRLIGVISLFKYYKYTLGISYVICCLMVLYYANNKIRFFLLMTITEFILFFKLLYSAYFPHVILLYIYLIVAFWLTPKLHKRDIPSYIFLIVFALLLNLNLDEKFRYILKNTNKTHIINYINEQNIDYVFTTWRYLDLMPSVSTKTIFPHYSEYSPKYKKNEYYVKNYIFDTLKNDKRNWKAIAITSHRVNDKSIQFFWGYSYVPFTLYITEFSKQKN